MKLYLDTNIIMDFLLGRDYSAHELFIRAISCEFYLVISELTIHELTFQKQKFYTLFSLLQKKIIRLPIKKEDKEKAKDFLQYTHHNDAIHAAAFLSSGANYFITRNTKDFLFLKNVKRPDEL